MAQRDRDESGRPRSARPRDSLGRPLAPGSAGIPRIPDDLELAPAGTLAHAQELLDRGLAFNAHEVLEAAWKHGPTDERMLWQGLTQLAVGITHVQRGNAKGAVSLLRKASIRLARDARLAPYGVDVAGLVDFADALIDHLKAGPRYPFGAAATASDRAAFAEVTTPRLRIAPGTGAPSVTRVTAWIGGGFLPAYERLCKRLGRFGAGLRVRVSWCGRTTCR